MPWLAVGCAVLYAIFLWRLAAELPGQAHPTASWPVAALEAILSVWLTVLCLLAGQRLLPPPRATMPSLAQTPYWTYLLPLPLLFAPQYMFSELVFFWPLQF